jgi:hypothetical protein
VAVKIDHVLDLLYFGKVGDGLLDLNDLRGELLDYAG